MSSFGEGAPAGDRVPASNTDTSAQPAFRRVLIPIKDTNQVEQVAELAERAGASEARILHLNLRENIGARRYPFETDSSAARVVEAAVLELRLAGIPASGQVCYTLLDKAAEAIVSEAAGWGADLIMLGSPRRATLTSRLLAGLTLRVLQRAPCPVLVASAAGDRAASHPPIGDHAGGAAL